MTALTRYQRLECAGLWRESPQAQRRNVFVSFGDASLIISDSRSQVVLTHWSLPAVERLNPDALPAIFAPGHDAAETLELSDDAMVSALETVRLAIDRQRPKPGRLRNTLLGGSLLLVLALLVFWMPEALIRHTSSVVPAAKRAEIGRIVLADMVQTAGAPCANPAGLEALTRLRDRVMGPGNGELLVMPEGIASTAHVPGPVILIGRSLIEQHESPDVAAGYILAERLRADRQDPMIALLRAVGLRATFTLLTTGNLPDGALAGYGTKLLSQTTAPVEPEPLLKRFAAMEVPAAPYAHALSPAADGSDPLIADDPYASIPLSAPVLEDSDWVGLQGICSS